MYEQVCKKYEDSLKQEKQIENEKRLMQQRTEHEKNLQSQQYKVNEKSTLETIRALNYEIEQLRLKNTLQQQQISDKKTICNELTKRVDELEARGIEPSNSSQNSSEDIISSKQRHSKKDMKARANFLRSKSFSRISEKAFLQTLDSEETDSSQKKLNKIKRSKSFDKENVKQQKATNFKSDMIIPENNDMKEYYESLCRAKDKQLETIRIAHQRRLERLISLEKQYKLLKDHLRSYVDEEHKTDGHSKSQCKHACSGALNDTGMPYVGVHPETVSGYTRNQDAELLRNQLKVYRHQNEKLLQENLDQKEEIDILNVKCGEQNERIQNFRLQLNYKCSEQEQANAMREKQYKSDLKQNNDKLMRSKEEIRQLKSSLNELESKYSQLFKERSKYIELSSKLSDENKRLYKRWFQLRTNENKFRNSIVDQMGHKYSSLAKSKQKALRVVSSNKFNKNSDGTESTNELLKRLVSSSSASTPKMLSDESLSSSVITLNEYDWESSSGK